MNKKLGVLKIQLKKTEKNSFGLVSECYQHWSHPIRRVPGLPYKGFHPGCLMVV